MSYYHKSLTQSDLLKNITSNMTPNSKNIEQEKKPPPEPVKPTGKGTGFFSINSQPVDVDQEPLGEYYQDRKK